ncbi:hypothetical protein D3C83_276740 [compost metagenome]
MAVKGKTKLGIYMTPDEQEMLREVAIGLHREGVFGMTNPDGSPVVSAVLTYLVVKEYKRQKGVNDE